jgi:acyl carrier protein
MTNQEIRETVIELAEDILELDLASMAEDELDLDALDVDSLDRIELLMAVQQEFGVKFTPDELKSMSSIGDVVAVIAAKL